MHPCDNTCTCLLYTSPAASLTRVGKTAGINYQNPILILDQRHVSMTIHCNLTSLSLRILNKFIIIPGHKIVMSMCNQYLMSLQGNFFIIGKICKKDVYKRQILF